MTPRCLWSTYPQPSFPLLRNVFKHNISLVSLLGSNLVSEFNPKKGSVRTFKTLSISVMSTLFASFFMSTLPPPPSPSSSSPTSSRFTPPSTPSPSSLLSLPQNSMKEFSCNMSSNAFRASVVRVRCHLLNSSSSLNTSKPNFVAGSELSRDVMGRAVNSAASEGAFEWKNACRLSKCFVRSWPTCSSNRRCWWLKGKDECRKRGSVCN